MFRSGAFVAERLGDLGDEQVQPNGVDLTVTAVFEQTEPGRITTDGKRVGDRRELDRTALSPDDRDGDGDGDAPAREGYVLEPGGYVLRYGETVRIPEQHVGFVLPRSSLLRNSCTLNTAVWDAGYEGRGEGLLQVHHRIELEAGARVGQLVLAAADHSGTYAGDYQGENL